LGGDYVTIPLQAPDDLVAALLSQDDIGLVVRGHIYIENELDKFIQAALPRPGELEMMEYSARVQLALACGLRPTLKTPLKAIGKLRNSFAHKLGTTLTEQHVNQMHDTLSKDDRKALEVAFLRTATELMGRPVTLKGLKARQRLGFCLAVLWGAVRAQTDQLLLAQAPQSK
jgi:hypothetical protein